MSLATLTSNSSDTRVRRCWSPPPREAIATDVMAAAWPCPPLALTDANCCCSVVSMTNVDY